MTKFERNYYKEQALKSSKKTYSVWFIIGSVVITFLTGGLFLIVLIPYLLLGRMKNKKIDKELDEFYITAQMEDEEAEAYKLEKKRIRNTKIYSAVVVLLGLIAYSFLKSHGFL